MTPQTRSPSGYSTWRLIAEELRSEIVDESLAPGTRLPTERELVERFGVHRHTVRQAVATLATEGLVARRQGSGTFVVERPRLVHRIGLRTRWSDSLGHRADASPGVLLEAGPDPCPPADVVMSLDLHERAALRTEMVRSVDGLALVRTTDWFVAAAVPDFARHYRDVGGSTTAALRAIGIDDYLRVSSTITARLATFAESTDMDLPGGAVVLVVRGLDALPDGTPLRYGISRFRADRVELNVDT
ncbi:phosphonate metabolism transcriptional regulator PhnF [Pseudonocardia sp. HH130630-07]|uniref:phosphonate metabolism transcriptional regulator PhnF n=1 Tax=Pseudonocardia sp. HH130630-07 TaxID=1690815 RepID=UPI000815129F|nr:phosphonate metabolism transcriptional regulator PhnF [Pseudonocardia sp. HH130630-07]ANY10555.1 phosphonate metabolism transcriptional regulator PhnF [Pseudonocardia sp. HH130630-07]